MTEPLRILVAEESEVDAKLVQHELKRGGLDFHTRRVQAEPDFRRELDEFQPHLVISDFYMPQFSRPASFDELSPFLHAKGRLRRDPS